MWAAIRFICALRGYLRIHQAQAKLPSHLTCRHDLAVMAVRILADSHPAHTCVLKRCRNCGLHAVEIHLGEWTLADFLRKESEIETLERMMK
jgi:hypothetical protein